MHFTHFIKDLKTQHENLNFETVKSTLEAKGLVVKSFRGLHIVSYVKRNTEHPPNFKDNLVRECRGLIFDAEFNVVCPGFNKFYDNESDRLFLNDEEAQHFVPELSVNSDEFKAILESEHTNITYAVDSSLVRLYYHDNRWRLATTRSIDASKTRWNSYRTFFQLFSEAAQSQFSPLDWMNLDRTKVYFLALVHPENRIVTPHTQSMLIHLTTFAKPEPEGVWSEDFNSDLGIAKPIPFDTENEEKVRYTSEEFVEAVKSLEWVYPGVVVRWIDENGLVQRTKIRCSEYEKVARLRGERRSMVERYLELKTDADKYYQFEEFVKYYPEYKTVEQSIENFARAVHQMYLDFFVHHTIRYISEKRVWEIIQELHTRFLRTKEKTTLNLVRQHVNSLPFPVLSEILLENRKSQ